MTRITLYVVIINKNAAVLPRDILTRFKTLIRFECMQGTSGKLYKKIEHKQMKYLSYTSVSMLSILRLLFLIQLP